MVKITYQESNNQYKVTIPPDIITAFGLKEGKQYDWVNVQGLAALRERK